MKTLAQLRQETRTRLGDSDAAIWTDTEIDGYLVDAYQQIGQMPVFWDVCFLENLPLSFTSTQRWEAPFLEFAGAIVCGVANYTLDDERDLIGDSRKRIGPGKTTSVWEAANWWPSLGGGAAIPATADVPDALTQIDRGVWDNRTIDGLEARRLARLDSRYELTPGEVSGFIWQKDGLRTVRKVRVPAAQADTVTVEGSFGLLRDPSDLSTDTIMGGGASAFDAGGFDNDAFFTDPDDAAVWGIVRRIPGHHPTGADQQGAPRRPFLDGKNVRIEHYRHGSAMVDGDDRCELPDRYAVGLRDYAMAQCLTRTGPGQDVKLAAFFADRWTRMTGRLQKRLRALNTERAGILGGEGQPWTQGVPRPQLPWPYGPVVR